VILMIPHEGLLLWIRTGITILIAVYSWLNYLEMVKEFKRNPDLEGRPWTFLYYLGWALSDITLRIILTCTPNLFIYTPWLAEHWFSAGLTVGVFLQFLAVRDMNRILRDG